MALEPFPSMMVAMFGFCLNAPLVLLGFCLNLFANAVLYHGHRYFSQKSFYIAARHLQIADLISLCAQGAIVLPIIALPPEYGQIYSTTNFVEFILTSETLAHMATFHFIGLQAFCQLHNVLLFQHNERAIYQLNNMGTFFCIMVWVWLAVLLFLFGVSHCAKRYNPALFYFYDTCYLEHTSKAGGYAMLNIWLAVLMFITFAIYFLGIWTLQRKIALVHPASLSGETRRGSMSVSVVMQPPTKQSLQSQMASGNNSVNECEPPAAPKNQRQQQQQQQRRPKTNRKQIIELFKSKAAFIQGLFMAVSLFMRFLGFYAFPWLGVTLFGSGIQALNERAVVNVLGNALILLSICSHQWIYWYWNLRVRVLVEEVRIYLFKKLRIRQNVVE